MGQLTRTGKAPNEVESVEIASSRQRAVRRGPPLGRHAAAVGLVVVLMLLFVWLQPGPDYSGPPYLGHLVLADTSFVLLCLILMLGAVARFAPRLRPVVPWARELGIGMFVTASLHVVILLAPDGGIWVHSLESEPPSG
jgi:hypothetical protein